MQTKFPITPLFASQIRTNALSSLLPVDKLAEKRLPRRPNSAANILLILSAVALSAFNGWLSVLSVLVFSGNESTRLWASIYLPATLWILAIVCWWFPKAGFVTYAVILGSSIFLCIGPLHHVHFFKALAQCPDNLRFALIGAALLLVNVFVPRETVIYRDR